MAIRNITVEEAAYFLGMHRESFCNLVRRGDLADIADAIPSETGLKRKYYIKAAAFLEKYGLTWDDIETIRAELVAKKAVSA
ncbi:MAG: hypothetical protein J6J38_07705 [Lachnospiraceae bacterium]|nr:hypothetical protein [Lachnospiraceae bacterium]